MCINSKDNVSLPVLTLKSLFPYLVIRTKTLVINPIQSCLDIAHKEHTSSAEESQTKTLYQHPIKSFQ